MNKVHNQIESSCCVAQSEDELDFQRDNEILEDEFGTAIVDREDYLGKQLARRE